MSHFDWGTELGKNPYGRAHCDMFVAEHQVGHRGIVGEGTSRLNVRRAHRNNEKGRKKMGLHSISLKTAMRRMGIL